MKRIIMLLMVLSSCGAMGQNRNGLLFQVTASGSPEPVRIILCLNGKGPLSCQNYQVSGPNLSIKATVNHSYPHAGIKVLSPGYTPTGCKAYTNGYCLFALNGQTPTPIVLNGLNITGLSVSETGIIPVGGGVGGITVTNEGSYPAYNVHANLPSSWTGVTQNSSNCTTLLPGASCILRFASSVPYIAQGAITVTGDNISFPPQTALAFSINGYLVFAIDSAHSARVIDTVNFPGGYEWGGNGTAIGINAQHLTDGALNTVSIVAALGTGSIYAARTCNESTRGGVMQGTWYLPALCEFGNLSAECISLGAPNISTLKALGFGNFVVENFWTSTEYESDPQYMAWLQVFPAGNTHEQVFTNKFFNLPSVRCARTISY